MSVAGNLVLVGLWFITYACGPSAGDLVDITDATLDEQTQTVRLTLGTCNSNATVAAHSTATEVVVQAAFPRNDSLSRLQGEDTCQPGGTLVLDAPLGDRRLIDAYDGRQLLPDP